MTKSFCFSVPAIREHGSLSFHGKAGSEKMQEALAGEVLLQGPFHVGIELAWRAGEVDYKGEVKGQWGLECSRCLAETKAEYKVKLEGTLKPAGGGVDLSEEVRQALLLALPIQSLCKPDCKGLCPKCRANRNVKNCGCAVAHA